MQAGDLVRWKQPQGDEIQDLFRVLEMRGNRVLVEMADERFADWKIKPTSVYWEADLEVVEQK